ncbi:MAG: putative thioesterase [Gammaproteobacteria bacterium]|nr:MAG: putative thioesterase [Gammaproteobacteria bacterium]
MDIKKPWFTTFGAQLSRPKLRLFCFPYAGGSAALYKDWSKSLAANNAIELCAVQLPGRGARIGESLIDNGDLLIERLVTAIRPLLDVPCVFFGHSMGAQVAWELTRALREEKLPQPKVLMVSGRSAPQLNRQREPIHHLPEAEFIQALGKLQGTPDELLQNAELMEFVGPMLRADFKVIETWQYRPQTPLRVPIVALGGEQDEGVGRDGISAWQHQTSIDLVERELPGGHFFITSAQDLVLAEVKSALNKFVFKSEINPRVTSLV